MKTSKILLIVFVCVLIVGFVLLLVGAALTSYFREKIRDAYKEKLPLVPNTETYKYFLNGSGNTYLEKFYLFNVTNPRAATEGTEKPNLQQIGPYIYRVELSRVNTSLTNGDTELSYAEIKKRYFVENGSVGGDVRDLVTTANIPVIALASMLRYSDPRVQEAVNQEFVPPCSPNRQEVFVRLPIKELLWGYENSGLVSALKVLDRSFGLHPMNSSIFGLQYQSGEPTGIELNGYSINTGLDDISKIHQIRTWNDQRNLPYWNSAYSNSINGTGARAWSPWLEESSAQQLNAFDPEWCRSIYYKFVNKTSSDDDERDDDDYDDIFLENVKLDSSAVSGETWRYVMPSEVLENNVINSGFCTPTTQQCMDTGVLNVTVCRDGYPLYMSQPHFYSASDVYTRAVKGLSPNEKRHQTRLNVHPVTGYTTSSRLKIQYSVELKASGAFSALDNFKKSLILPVAWKETIFDMSHADLERLERNIDDVTSTRNRYKGYHYLLLGLGGFLTLISFIVIIVLLVIGRSTAGSYDVAVAGESRDEDDERRSLLHDS